MKKASMVILILLLTSAASSAVFAQANKPPKAVPAARAQILAVLNSTADGWNSGDLQKYLAPYVPEATEMTAEGPKGGVEHIENTMRQGFWKTGRPLQNLRYENIEVRMLGKENALVTGQYILTGGGRPDRKGWFTTVWTKTKQGWRMIHDHS